MSWIKALLVFLQLALQVLKRLDRQRILKEGEVRTIKHLLEKANALAKNANDARNAVSNNPYEWVRDKYNRTAGNKDGSV